MGSTLDETRDILRLYLYHVGESSIPVLFHAWSCLSLVGAAVANRVSVEIHRGSPLYPNLYVFLIGPSGTGKGIAIDTAMKFVRDNTRINSFAATKVTSEALTERLAKRNKKGERANVFLGTPEMALSVGRGERADNFIRAMTELFTGRSYAMTESTITRGDNALAEYCINWLAGTTVEWLNDSIRKEDIAGGFFARVIPVMAQRPTERKTFPHYPDDYDDIVGHLAARIEELSWLEGTFDFTAEARDVFQAWNEERPMSSDPLMAPSHERRAELVLKVAMIRALMEDTNLVIRKHHIADATRLISETMKFLPLLIDRASESIDTMGLAVLEEYIKSMKQVRQRTLFDYALKRGIGPKRFSELTNALVLSQRVLRLTGPAGLIYTWKGKKKMPVPEMPPPDMTFIEGEE